MFKVEGKDAFTKHSGALMESWGYNLDEISKQLNLALGKITKKKLWTGSKTVDWVVQNARQRVTDFLRSEGKTKEEIDSVCNPEWEIFQRNVSWSERQAELKASVLKRQADIDAAREERRLSRIAQYEADIAAGREPEVPRPNDDDESEFSY